MLCWENGTRLYPRVSPGLSHLRVQASAGAAPPPHPPPEQFREDCQCRQRRGENSKAAVPERSWSQQSLGTRAASSVCCFTASSASFSCFRFRLAFLSAIANQEEV
ncbi:hypothetical protein NDU88_004345 [Pleurodeles waltl]|uniref:Uncharacterized protein n=1 Tax=Pleurodeles waltl TaxID=8319 RepID=A0AAV7UF21_PLEWA|nr:hypothetical protein NDU88_004345 [Pleurodeles waltl]